MAARQRLRASAPAKINLHLRVGPVQPDGYHPLLTWMVTVGLFDTLTFELHPSSAADRPAGDAAAAGGRRIEFTCDDATLPMDERNLVVRAARAIESAARRSAPASGAGIARAGQVTRIALAKRIPHAAGLGGGSSDASRTLEALRELWRLPALSRSALCGLAATLGSDVPFFLHGPSSVCRGRGEIVEPIAPPQVARWAVLMLPPIALSTAAVYREFDARGLGKAGAGATWAGPGRGAEAGEPAWQEWARLSAAPLLARLVNDLETPAFALCPELARLRSDCEQDLGRIVRMSGSGSSLFTLFDGEAEARPAAERLSRRTRAVAVELAPHVDDDLTHVQA